MSILDDAIREHLELKRAHGADEAELKKLEDEAFGPPARPDEPDSFAEGPTEFLAAPEGGADGKAAEDEGGGRRIPNIADLQEPPPPPAEAAVEAEAPPEDKPPAEAEEPQHVSEAEPEPESQPKIDGGHSTEERHAIAEQPTELFDVEGEIDAAPDATSPSDEQLIDAELSEPRLAPVDPLAGIEASEPEAEIAEEAELEEEEEDDFFSEQRLSDELNQALETPLPGEPTGGPVTEEHPVSATPHTEEAEAYYAEPDSEEHEVPAEREPDSEEHEPDSEEHEVVDEDEDEPDSEEHQREPDSQEHHNEPDTEEHEHEPRAASKEPEDVLEDTPEFLEDAPEDDNLWFEQQPPKDFDFDD
jgi:hypothetical protein